MKIRVRITVSYLVVATSEPVWINCLALITIRMYLHTFMFCFIFFCFVFFVFVSFMFCFIFVLFFSFLFYFLFCFIFYVLCFVLYQGSYQYYCINIFVRTCVANHFYRHKIHPPISVSYFAGSEFHCTIQLHYHIIYVCRK